MVCEGRSIVHTDVVLQKLHVPGLKHPVYGNAWSAGCGIKLFKGCMLLVCQLGRGWEVALADLVVRTHIEGRHFILRSRHT